MAISYMQRRKSGIYEFRKRLPESLAGKPAPEHVKAAHPELVNPETGRFKRELVRSLRTNDARAARKQDLREAHSALELFDAAQRLIDSGPPPLRAARQRLTPEDLREIEAAAQREVLEADDDARNRDFRSTEQGLEDRKHLHLLSDVTRGGRFGLKEGGLDALGEEIEKLLPGFEDALARRDASVVEVEVRKTLRDLGVVLEPDSEERHEVGLAVLRGVVGGLLLRKERQKGRHVPTPKPAPAATERGPRLSEAHLAWTKGGGASGAKTPGRSALLEAAPAVRRFTELHGDMRLGDVTKAHAREYRDALTRLPKRLPTKIARLPLPKLLAKNLKGYPLRDAVTVNKMLDMMSAIVSRAKREGLLDALPGYVNPFDRDVKLIVDRKQKQRRDAFTGPELDMLFSSPVFREGARPDGGGGDAAFWFPLIGLLSGMRLEEIAGLRIADLKEDSEGAGWYFDIHPHWGRAVKTETSIRQVPVHPALIGLGLLARREKLAKRSAPGASLWPDVKAASGRALSAPWSSWFTRYRKSAGITDEGRVFHSFRHAFKAAARNAGIPEEIHDAITGHANSSVGRRYGGVSLKRLAEAVAMIEVPESVGRLLPGATTRGDR